MGDGQDCSPSYWPCSFVRFMNTVFFLLPKFHGVMKTLCLEVVLCRSEEVTDLYLQLKSKDFIQIMRHRWVGNQPPVLRCSRLIKHWFVQLFLPLRKNLQVFMKYVFVKSTSEKKRRWGGAWPSCLLWPGTLRRPHLRDHLRSFSDI